MLAWSSEDTKFDLNMCQPDIRVHNNYTASLFWNYRTDLDYFTPQHFAAFTIIYCDQKLILWIPMLTAELDYSKFWHLFKLGKHKIMLKCEIWFLFVWQNCTAMQNPILKIWLFCIQKATGSFWGLFQPAIRQGPITYSITCQFIKRATVYTNTTRRQMTW